MPQKPTTRDASFDIWDEAVLRVDTEKTVDSGYEFSWFIRPHLTYDEDEREIPGIDDAIAIIWDTLDRVALEDWCEEFGTGEYWPIAFLGFHSDEAILLVEPNREHPVIKDEGDELFVIELPHKKGSEGDDE